MVCEKPKASHFSATCNSCTSLALDRLTLVIHFSYARSTRSQGEPKIRIFPKHELQTFALLNCDLHGDFESRDRGYNLTCMRCDTANHKGLNLFTSFDWFLLRQLKIMASEGWFFCSVNRLRQSLCKAGSEKSKDYWAAANTMLQYCAWAVIAKR